LSVELDPDLDFAQNAEVYFKRAEKILRGAEKIQALLGPAEAELERWRAEAERAERWRLEVEEAQGALSDESAEGLRRFREVMIEEGVIRPKAADPAKDVAAAAQAFRRKYGKDVDCYRSPSGFEVVCGRSSVANEHVSLKLARGNFVWFHTDGRIPGSHVLIRANWDEVKDADIKFAAQLAAYFSKARGRKRAPVMYCRGHQVRKIKGTPMGQVSIAEPRHRIEVAPAAPPAA